MYLTHHFAHQETLDRARAWLARVGFRPEQMEVHADAAPRIALKVNLPQAARAQLLLSAIELSDPDGWPGLWDHPRATPAHPRPSAWGGEPAPAGPSTTVIGWHPPDWSFAEDPDLAWWNEAMSR
jgi:hypothetical protein